MGSFGSIFLCLFLFTTGLQRSVCWLKEIQGLRGGRNTFVSLQLEQEEHRPVEEVLDELKLVRKRVAGDPQLAGDHTFDDGYPTALIHYSGEDSTVIFVLTYQQSANGITTRSNLYRSANYGATFENINYRLDSGNSVVLSPRFFASDFNKNFLLFAHATESRLYYTLNEGDSFHITEITSVDINPRTINYHPDQDGWMMAVDSSIALYVSQDFGQSWTKVDENIAFYQWADPVWDVNSLKIYYTTRDPDNSDLTVNLFISAPPYTTSQQFDPNFGAHDAFLLNGPYIFAQRTDADNNKNLYVSHMRKPFRLAKIPTPYNHQNYLVSHIDELQAMVVIEHEGNFYNLYLSDTSGVDYSLSLRDIVVERGSILDLEIINGVNGTLIANQYVRDDPSQQNSLIRTLITLDNGGFWELIIPPDRDVNNNPLNCEPPLCSLHFHMDSSAYARLGVYSTDSAPGLIIAHGNANSTLLNDPDLFISRDGGVTWEETLKGSWGVSVADHGGLLVAARDYHQSRSNELLYSCDEGYSWLSFEFSTTPSIIFGVITEPGQHTTVVSLYGTSSGQWRVFTVEFESIFDRVCTDSDYVDWMPWDLRSDTDCVLGSTVTIERRRARTCCLNGREYDREVSVVICECNGEDFECDYGYARDSLTGPCVRDPDVILPDPCAEGKDNYTASTGYRKIAGDLCQGGEEKYAHFIAPCCGNSTLPPTVPFPPNTDTTDEPSHGTTQQPQSSHSSSSSNYGPLIGTGIVIAILGAACGVLLIILVIMAMKYSSLRKRYMRVITAGECSTTTTQRFAFQSDRESSMEPLTPGDPSVNNEEDDDPLIP